MWHAISFFWLIIWLIQNNNLVFCSEIKYTIIGMKRDKNEYVQANRDCLSEKSKEDGVMAQPGGVYYKVLAEGNSLKDSGVQPRIRL